MILIVFFRYFTYKFKTFGGFRGFGVWMSGFGFCSGISFRGRVRVGELKVEVVPLVFRGFGSLNTSLIRTTSELHSLKKTFKLNLWYPYKSTPLHIFQSIVLREDWVQEAAYSGIFWMKNCAMMLLYIYRSVVFH